MKRILFVDDQPSALDALARTFQALGEDWDLSFARGTDEGFTALETSLFDVVVCDMGMSHGEGAEFLSTVRRRWPDTIRLALAGDVAVEASLRVLPVAHQSLRKPCDPETFRQVVRRVLAVRDTLTAEKIRATIGGLTTLPHPPRIYTRLLAVLADTDYGTVDIARVIETEASLVAKILQMVNSGFFGRAQRVTNIKMAVGILGSTLIRNVTLASELAEDLGRSPHVSAALLARQQQHGQLTAGIAHEITTGTPFREDAFTAGLLHDVGILIIAAHYAHWLDRALSAARQHEVPFHEAEAQVNPVGHAEAGAYLLGLWALPAPIVEAVAYHHRPGITGSTKLDAVGAVHIASVLAQEVRPEFSPFPGTSAPALDLDYLESVGGTARLDGWRATAARLAGIPAAQPQKNV